MFNRITEEKTHESNGMNIKSIGIIGYGAFGAYMEALVKRYLPDLEVRIYSRRATPDSKQFFSEAEVCAADVVVVCSAISEYEETLKRLLPQIPKTSVLVDVATVKVHTTALLKTLAADYQYIATHPMFGPESDKKHGGDVTGFRIVITEHTLPTEDYVALKALLEEIGFVVVEMSAEEHDKQLAETLFLTHYIGQTMKAGEFLRTRIDTVSFQSLMNAVESVMNDEKLFHDVYRFNPYCEAVAKRFHDAQECVFNYLLQAID